MSLRIREIIVRAEVTESPEDRTPQAAQIKRDSQDQYEPDTMTRRFYEEDRSKANER